MPSPRAAANVLPRIIEARGKQYPSRQGLPCIGILNS